MCSQLYLTLYIGVVYVWGERFRGKSRNESGFVSIVSRARHDNKCDSSQMATY